MKAIRFGCLAVLFGLLVVSLPSACHADQFLVTLDTTNLMAGSGLTYGAGTPYSLDFTLTSGDIPTQTNTVTISNVMLGGGTFTPGTGVGTNQATGDLGSTITLISGTSFFNDFYQAFVPGTSVSFVMTTTSNVLVTPDNFSFSILDSSLNPIPTTDTFSSTMLNVDLVPPLSPSSFNVFSGIDQTSNPSLGPPIVTPNGVPEPASIALLAGGVGILCAWRRSRRAVPAAA